MQAKLCTARTRVTLSRDQQQEVGRSRKACMRAEVLTDRFDTVDFGSVLLPSLGTLRGRSLPAVY
jgi:hypothetical protein